MWFLSVNQQQSGPYSSEELAQLISASQAHTGFVCAQGEQRWVPLEQHPTFGPLVAGHATSGRASSAAAPVRPARLDKPAVFLIALLGLPFVLAVVAIVVRLAIGSAGELAQWVPKDVTYYIEVADVADALESMAEMRFIDQEDLDEDHVIDELVDGFERGFDVDADLARDVVEDIETVAFASRERESKDESALLLRLSSPDAMNELLTTKRFEPEGKLGEVGQRYSLRSSALDPDAMSSNLDGFLRRFDTDERNGARVLAWFPDHHLLVIGNARFVEDMADVIDDGEGSLADSEEWESATIDRRADAIAYVDTMTMSQGSPEAREIARRLFDDAGAVTWSTRVEDHGTLTEVQGHLSGSMISHGGLPEPAGHALFLRLPASSTAYATLAIPKDLVEVEDLHEVTLGLMAFAGPERVAMMRDLVKQVVSALWAAAGDELVIGVAMARDLRIEESRDFSALLDGLALGVVLELGDRGAIDEQVNVFRNIGLSAGDVETELSSGPYSVSFTSNGIVGAAKRPGLPSFRVELTEDALIVAVGGMAMVDEFVEATLGRAPRIADDPAHERAIAAVAEDVQAHVWIDVGRLAGVLPAEARDEALSLGELGFELGFSPRLLVLEGEDRLIFAAGLHVEEKGTTWHYGARVLNGDALAGPLTAKVVTSVVEQLARAYARTERPMLAPSWDGRHSAPRASPGTPSFW